MDSEKAEEQALVRANIYRLDEERGSRALSPDSCQRETFQGGSLPAVPDSARRLSKMTEETTFASRAVGGDLEDQFQTGGCPGRLSQYIFPARSAPGPAFPAASCTHARVSPRCWEGSRT